jgi:hypothetical protein
LTVGLDGPDEFVLVVVDWLEDGTGVLLVVVVVVGQAK